MKQEDIKALQPGDVVRLTTPDYDWFNGRIAMVSDVKNWGAIVVIVTDEGDAYFRASWDQMEKSGNLPHL